MFQLETLDHVSVRLFLNYQSVGRGNSVEGLRDAERFLSTCLRAARDLRAGASAARVLQKEFERGAPRQVQ